MKKLIALLAIIALSLTGCFLTKKEPYTFRQSVDQIEKIEIALKEEYDPNLSETPVVLKILKEQEHQAIIDAISTTEGNVVLSPPGRGIGVYIIQITYKNGEIELIGDYNNGYITPGGEKHQDGYCFNSEQFYEVISRYLGRTVAPPASN